jgi:hypothetical protein
MRYYIVIFTLFLCSCTEEFNLELNKTPKRLVVDGVITDTPGPYYVRLTWSNNSMQVTNDTINGQFYYRAEPATGAVVVLKDDHGNIDTLKPALDFYEYYEYMYDSAHNIVDSVLSKFDNFLGGKRGYYITKNILGIAGYTYSLYIKIVDKEFLSSCYMPVLPTIDSLSIISKYSEIKKDYYYVPIIYFKDPPNERNFYLFQLYGTGLSYYSNYTNLPTVAGGDKWNFSIISDEFLKSDVKGLDIESGSSVKNIPLYRYFPGDTIVVSIQSLTEEAYTFYRELIAQFKNDGAAFKPVPASPMGNLNNGALGLFRASSVKVLNKKVPNHNQYK